MNGGVWRSQNGGATCSARTEDQPSLSIGALAIDPNAANRVFAGTGEYLEGSLYHAFGQGLLYSSDSGETWAPLAGATFNRAAISRILFDPADSANHMFLSCDSGVYESNTGGSAWTLIHTGSASDLVMLGSGASLQLIAAIFGVGLFREPGVFSEDHVYFLASGGSAWTTRSNGLAQANPVNSLAIDATDGNAVFFGADTSVFRWDSAAGHWNLWAQGLPNSPVNHLTIHQPSRLIRAATYGRGAWERGIDSFPQPMVDIFMRDHILDDGRPPTVSNVPDPFSPPNRLWWWQSVDIKVDAPPFQTPAPVTDDIAHANMVEHRNPRRGMSNRVNIQVHNRGPVKATNVVARVFVADASMSLPDLPADFWTLPKPFSADPSAASWTPVGPAGPPVDLEPGQTLVVHWVWPISMSAAAIPACWRSRRAIRTC